MLNNDIKEYISNYKEFESNYVNKLKTTTPSRVKISSRLSKTSDINHRYIEDFDITSRSKRSETKDIKISSRSKTSESKKRNNENISVRSKTSESKIRHLDESTLKSIDHSLFLDSKIYRPNQQPKVIQIPTSSNNGHISKMDSRQKHVENILDKKRMSIMDYVNLLRNDAQETQSHQNENQYEESIKTITTENTPRSKNFTTIKNLFKESLINRKVFIFKHQIGKTKDTNPPPKHPPVDRDIDQIAERLERRELQRTWKNTFKDKPKLGSLMVEMEKDFH